MAFLSALARNARSYAAQGGPQPGVLTQFGKLFSGIGGGQARQPRINDFGNVFGTPGAGGPTADYSPAPPYLQGPSSLSPAGQAQMGEMMGMLGGGSQPVPWTPQAVKKPGAGGPGFGERARNALSWLGEDPDFRDATPGWFGNFQSIPGMRG